MNEKNDIKYHPVGVHAKIATRRDLEASGWRRDEPNSSEWEGREVERD